MKNFLFKPLFVLAMAAAVLTSCSNDDSDGSSPEAPAGTMIANIAGASFVGVGGAQIYNNEIIIGGTAGKESISIIISKAAEVGTYDVKGAKVGTTPDAEINYTPDSKTLFTSIAAADGEKVGTVTITEINQTAKTISGTFSTFVILNGEKKEIASGSFTKVPFVTASASTMTAKIDGEVFTTSVAVGLAAQGSIGLNGQTANGSKIIVLSVGQTIKPGTYTIGETIFGTYTVNASSFYLTSSGSLTISKHDTSAKRIEGTFNFIADPISGEGKSVTVTDGAFAITYR